MEEKLTISALRQMKRDGRKIVGVVAWDTEIARIADRAGVDLISVGDSVGVNLWGHATDAEVTVDEMLICCKAVRRGSKRALVSCDIPSGPTQQGVDGTVYAAKWIDARTETYGNAAKLSLEAFRALIDDVRSGRQIRGG